MVVKVHQARSTKIVEGRLHGCPSNVYMYMHARLGGGEGLSSQKFLEISCSERPFWDRSRAAV